MSKAGLRTLPKRDRDNSESHLCIISVDKAAHTVCAQINGCTITAVCREKSNPDIYESIKGILLQSVIDKSIIVSENLTHYDIYEKI